MTELIVALDVSNKDEAKIVLKKLGESISFYKIGLELFTAEGPDIVKLVKDANKKVFLDLKFHDIPRTVERAVKSGATLGVDLMTIHSCGGKSMIQAAHNAAAEFGEKAPKILAVTALTSLDESDLNDLGIMRLMPDHVEAMGKLAIVNGSDGIVCSPREVANMSKILKNIAPEKGLCFVTPGVRPLGAAVGDQKRIATPTNAVRDGSTHLVVGRPILEAEDPVAAAIAISNEIKNAQG